MLDEEFVKEIEGSKIYIGKLVADKLSATLEGTQKEIRLQEETHAQVFNIQKVLINLLLHALKNNYLCLDQQDIIIEVTDWWDEAPILGKGLLAWFIGFKYDNTVFKNDAPFAAVKSNDICLMQYRSPKCHRGFLDL